MEMWDYRSLEWIHKVREANYEKTREQAPEKIIKESLEATSRLIRRLNLKLLYPEDVISGIKIK
jgi:hypothetical protein